MNTDENKRSKDIDRKKFNKSVRSSILIAAFCTAIVIGMFTAIYNLDYKESFVNYQLVSNIMLSVLTFISFFGILHLEFLNKRLKNSMKEKDNQLEHLEYLIIRKETELKYLEDMIEEKEKRE